MFPARYLRWRYPLAEWLVPEAFPSARVLFSMSHGPEKYSEIFHFDMEIAIFHQVVAFAKSRLIREGVPADGAERSTMLAIACMSAK